MSEDIEYQIGCMCGRFQVHELHDAHKNLIDQVVNNHKKVILFLGVAAITPSKRNPLDFDTRKRMIQQEYPNITIVPLPDMESDIDWSKEMDKRIREIFPHGNVLLYGGRDSFIPYYSGVFDTKELEQYTFISGTEVRKKISEEIKNSSDFRSGIIYNSYNQDDKVLTYIDIRVLNSKINRELITNKTKKSIGDYINTNDNSLEESCYRILKDKIGLSEDFNTIKFRYIKSNVHNDWKYKNISKIISILYEVDITQVDLDPSNEIYELNWREIQK